MHAMWFRPVATDSTRRSLSAGPFAGQYASRAAPTLWGPII